MQMRGMTLNSLRSTIDALHNSAFLFPVARKRGYGCMNLQKSTGNMAAHMVTTVTFLVLYLIFPTYLHIELMSSNSGLNVEG